MPSQTNSYALITLWNYKEAPWKFPTWQKITGIENGLFPEDDAQLPHGLSRKDVIEIRSYFDSFLREPEEKRLKLHTGKAQALPGRDKWKKWLTSASRKWKLHTLVVEAFNEKNVNPNQIVRISNLDSWPEALTYITIALDTIGVSLFGDDSLDETGLLQNALRNPVKVIAQTSWNLLRVQHNRMETKLLAAEEAAMTAFKKASGDKPTKATITCAIKAMAKWRNLAELNGNNAVLSRIDENIERLEELMASVGAVVNADKKKAKPKSTYRNAAQLASEADVDFLVRLYEDLLNAPEEEDSPPLQLEPQLDIGFGTPEGDGSLGVELEMPMSSDRLADQLGFTNRLPFLFNEYCHTMGLVAWNKPSLFDNPQHNPDLVPLQLHWHQLAGLHAIIRKCFTPKPQKVADLGILIADDVGLGKTGMAISTIAFLAHIINLKSVKIALPKIIQQRPYLGDKDVLPDQPHLIVVPGTLLAQWVTELQTFFKKHVVEILVYPTKGGEHAAFWAPNGPYETSNHDPSQRIIVASHSSLFQDYKSVFRKEKVGAKLPWDLPGAINGARRQDTLYGRKYLSCILDEAHQLRNINASYYAATRIRECGLITLALTATPVQTKTPDAASMGRIIGIPYFLSPEAHADAKADAKALRKAKLEEKDNEGLSPDNSPVRLVHVNSSLRMQKEFDGHLIRRTTLSVDWQGKRLLTLPPIKRIMAVLKLTDREMSIINELAETAKENVSAANGAAKFLTKNFYVDYRMACGFACEGDNPKVSSFQEWTACLSTKMDVTAQVIRHHLERDDAPTVTFENGKPVFPQLPSTPIFTRTMKIVIFQLFPSLRDMLTQCLSLYGIDSMAIDGTKSYEARANTIAVFKASTTCKVLIISSVGSAGLNLAFCNCVIYIDQTWSSQDERQIDGRVWRQPQDKEVIIYHMLADQTSDIMLSAMASTKRDMLDAFLDKNAGEELMLLLSGRTIPGDDDEEEVGDGVPSVSRKKSTSSLKSIQSNDNDGAEEPPQKAKVKVTAKQRMGNSRQGQASKRPIVIESSPEPSERSTAKVVPGGDTSYEDGASEEGGGLGEASSSDGESMSMNLDLEDLNIHGGSQDFPPLLPPPSPERRKSTKRPRQWSPPIATAPGDPFASNRRQDLHLPSSDDDEAPAKVMRMGPSQFAQFPVPRARANKFPGIEGRNLAPREPAQRAVSGRALPTGGGQQLNRPRSKAPLQPPSYTEMVFNSRASFNSVDGPSSTHGSGTPTPSRFVANPSLMTPPAQPFGPPSANKSQARKPRREAPSRGERNPLKAPSTQPPRAVSNHLYQMHPEDSDGRW